MDKNEPVNGYENYKKWFDIIEKKCDENHFIGTLDDNYYSNYKFYKLDNDLNVYINGDNTIITDEEMDFENQASVIKMQKNESRKRFVSLDINNGLASIYYGPESTIAKEIVGPGKDYCCLPATIPGVDQYSDKRKSEISGNLPIDMRELLSRAVDRADNEETKDVYERAMDFYDLVKETVELEIINEKNSEKNEVYEEDKLKTLLNELEQISVDELENMLKITENENAQKRNEFDYLKKRDLILQIKNAIDEGKRLDAKIAEVKANIYESR